MDNQSRHPPTLAGRARGGGMSGYNPDIPWGGCGSPCGDLRMQRHREEWHALYPLTPPPVRVEFPGLADCRECPMCGGCETHEGCATDWNHIAWHAMFASPGEPECGDEGVVPGGQQATCALTRGHGGGWHQRRDGSGWRMRKVRRA
jgi:hypothetical protein